MPGGAFAVFFVLRKKGLMGKDLEDLNGLYYRSPAAAVLLLIFMLSLAGIPPTAGFMGKYLFFLPLSKTTHRCSPAFPSHSLVPLPTCTFATVLTRCSKQPLKHP